METETNVSIITDIEQLHKVATKINKNEKYQEYVDALVKTANATPNAAGLAGPQIGLEKRIFLANLSKGQQVFINPEIIWTSPDMNLSTESCLSIPDVSKNIYRHAAIKIKAHVLDNKKLSEVEMFLKGFDSYVFQHEYDHLNGKLITDHPEVEKNHLEMVAEKQQQRMSAKQENKKIKKQNAANKLQKHIEHNSLSSSNYKKFLQKLSKRIRIDRKRRNKFNKMLVEKNSPAEIDEKNNLIIDNNIDHNSLSNQV